MKICKCNGNSSLRRGLGRILCDCGGSLEIAQVIDRIISRLDECDDQDSNLIQGLVAADMGECDRCREWHKESELIRAGDRCTCEMCFDPNYFIQEGDDQELATRLACELVRVAKSGRYVSYRRRYLLALLPHDHTGMLCEPFLTEYRKYAA